MNVAPDYRSASQVRCRELEKLATQLLRQKGYAPNGERRSRPFDPNQCAFERLLVRTPTGGKPGWRR